MQFDLTFGLALVDSGEHGRFGSAVQTKGLGSTFVSATKRLMATYRSMTDRNTPRLRRWRVSLAKKPSTALSQDAEVGVRIEEADELLVAMVLHVAADDGAIKDVEGWNRVVVPER